uniref:Uncharacterized protein n=1 Tax=Octactis speculum TaxID=3111310 RepID=A0A7S2MAM4_9STRA
MRPPLNAKPINATDFQDLCTSIGLTLHAVQKGPSKFMIMELQQLASQHYFTTSHLLKLIDCFQDDHYMSDIIVALFGRLLDLHNLGSMLDLAPTTVANQVNRRLGRLNVMSPLRPSGNYVLRMNELDQLRLLRILMDIAEAEATSSLEADSHSDINIVKLYQMKGNLSSINKKTQHMTVRLTYKETSMAESRVPNFRRREDFLKTFLVGSTPMHPDVTEIIKQYNEMSAAGFVVNGDIARCHASFVKTSKDDGTSKKD